MSSRARIVATLHAAGDFVSGRDLAGELGVSRTAVWKQIAALEEQGFVIERARGRGYRLTATPGGLSEGEIAASLLTEWLGRSLICKALTGSTNSDVSALARCGASEGTVVVADAQTAGRGRLGRSWVSRPGLNLYLSILLRPRIVPAAAPQLALVAGLAVANAFEEEGMAAAIKWPNDVLLGGRKACGILTELEAEADRVAFVVVGIGVNLNSLEEDFPPDLRSRATSLRVARGREVERARFTAQLLSCFERCYEQFRDHGFAALAGEWERRSALVGRELTIEGAGETIRGEYAGIDPEGALLLRDRSGGGLKRVLAGDVTIVGGYS